MALRPTDSMFPDDAGDTVGSPRVSGVEAGGGRAAAEGEVSAGDISSRFGRRESFEKAGGSLLRLTRQQRNLLREGLADLRELFTDAELWGCASDEAFQAEAELGIAHLGAGYCMWTSSMAALTHGGWWLLMPRCGAPVLQDTVCDSLAAPFLERRAEYAELRRAIEEEGRYPALAKVLERTERIRCMLAVHVRAR